MWTNGRLQVNVGNKLNLHSSREAGRLVSAQLAALGTVRTDALVGGCCVEEAVDGSDGKAGGCWVPVWETDTS